ncbi:hypothetical protein PM030_15290 [Halorubrum ezzemoulense]|uniref:hypothetical protein n=1 Tax=Halorubrum TaxID=56688 RepID=UPI0010F8F142|nr:MULTISPECIES: hypothetical protein [Halorubrum]MDB2283235.1 hypothetical protein [Halorubrum ezzemoulense]TKX63366.1 hypothetical protein EXE47_13725 [Halorubrum sp. GN12_10-3_MGM]
MNRRQVLATMGALGGGGAVVTGTGAFTSVEANRDVSVQVADDTDALLRMAAAGEGNDEYVTTNGGELGINLTSSNPTDAGGQGVNANATTVIADLFEIQNQGTQEIDVEVTPLSFIDTGSGNTLVVLVVPQTGFPSVTLGVGDTETYSLLVDSFSGGGNLQISDTITVTGEAI